MKKLVSVLLAIVLCVSSLPILARAEDTPTAPTSVTITYNPIAPLELENNASYCMSQGFLVKATDTDDVLFTYKDGVMTICKSENDTLADFATTAYGGTLTIQSASGVTGTVSLRYIETTGDLVLKDFKGLTIDCNGTTHTPITAKKVTFDNCKNTLIQQASIYSGALAITGLTVKGDSELSVSSYGTLSCTPSIEDNSYIKLKTESGRTNILTSDGEFSMSSDTASDGLTVDSITLQSNTAYTAGGGIVTVMPAAEATSRRLTITLYNATINGKLDITAAGAVDVVSKGTNKIENSSGAAVSTNQSFRFYGDENSSLTLKGAPAVSSLYGITFTGGTYKMCNTTADPMGDVLIKKDATVTLSTENDATLNMSGYWVVDEDSTLNITKTAIFTGDSSQNELEIIKGGTVNINRGVTLNASAATVTNNGTLQNDGKLKLADNTTAADIKTLNLTGWGYVRAGIQNDYGNDGTKVTVANVYITDSDPTGGAEGYHWNADTKTLTLTNIYAKKFQIDVNDDVTIKIKGKVIVAGVIEVSGNGTLKIVGEGADATLRSGALLAPDRDVYIENIAVSNAYHKDFVNSYNADSTGVLVNSLDMKVGSTYKFENLSLTSKNNPDGLDKIASGLPSGYEIYKATGGAEVQKTDGTTATNFTITAKKKPSGGSSAPTLEPSVTQPGVGGTVEVSTTNPTEGETIVVTPKKDDGYVIDTIKVTDENGNTVEISRNSDGSFEFTQPDTTVTIEVTYKEKPTFNDIPDNAWYAEAVDFAVENGLMNGMSKNAFKPNEPMTRAMFATVLWNYAGKPNGFTANFKDMKSGDWFYNAVAWATEMGVVNGMPNGKFMPNEPITREQMVMMLWNFAGKPEATGNLSQFPDGNRVSSYAQSAMAWAVESGVIHGRSNGALDPRGTATRAEVTTMLMNYLNK